MYNLEVLISTMNKNNCIELLRKMNINSDAVVIDQCDTNCYSEIDYRSHKVKITKNMDRGLSRSRNSALILSSSDILCIADDDMEYVDGYENIIKNEYEKYPDADAILFYVEAINGTRKTKEISKSGRFKANDFRKYSSVNITIKRNKLMLSNIRFNTEFGSGSTYNCGEDTIFLKDLINKKFKIYKSNKKIANVDMSKSSWFTGYNKDFFFNKGALLVVVYPHIWFIAILYLSIKNSIVKFKNCKFIPDLFCWYITGAVSYIRKKKLII